jgi:hypothetical protein
MVRYGGECGEILIGPANARWDLIWRLKDPLIYVHLEEGFFAGVA